MKFEGEEVTGGSAVTIRQFKGDIELPLAVDETVELRVLAEVSEVSHVTNKRNGLLTRVHILHVKEIEVV